MMINPTIAKLQALGLGAMAAALADQLATPGPWGELAFEDRLGLLVDREADARDSRRLAHQAQGGQAPLSGRAGGHRLPLTTRAQPRCGAGLGRGRLGRPPPQPCRHRPDGSGQVVPGLRPGQRRPAPGPHRPLCSHPEAARRPRPGPGRRALRPPAQLPRAGGLTGPRRLPTHPGSGRKVPGPARGHRGPGPAPLHPGGQPAAGGALARGHGRSNPGRGRSRPRPAVRPPHHRQGPVHAQAPARTAHRSRGDRLRQSGDCGVAWSPASPLPTTPNGWAGPRRRRCPAGAGHLFPALGPAFGPALGRVPLPKPAASPPGRRLRPPPAGPYRARSRMAWRTRSLGNQGGDNQAHALLNVIGAVPDRVRNRPERVSAFSRNGCPLSPDYTRARPCSRAWPCAVAAAGA